MTARHGWLSRISRSHGCCSAERNYGLPTKIAKEAREAEKGLKRQNEYESTRRERIAIIQWAMRRRAQLFNLDLAKMSAPRSIREPEGDRKGKSGEEKSDARPR